MMLVKYADITAWFPAAAQIGRGADRHGESRGRRFLVGVAPCSNGKERIVSASQNLKLKRIVKNLAKLGIPFDLAAILIADQMRVSGIPITPENLEFAFS